jgi:hypothetical protein
VRLEAAPDLKLRAAGYTRIHRLVSVPSHAEAIVWRSPRGEVMSEAAALAELNSTKRKDS